MPKSHRHYSTNWNTVNKTNGIFFEGHQFLVGKGGKGGENLKKEVNECDSIGRLLHCKFSQLNQGPPTWCLWVSWYLPTVFRCLKSDGWETWHGNVHFHLNVGSLLFFLYMCVCISCLKQLLWGPFKLTTLNCYLVNTQIIFKSH